MIRAVFLLALASFVSAPQAASAAGLDATTQTVAVLPVVFGAPALEEPAPRSGDARQRAVDACLGQNPSGPSRAVEAVADGMGDWLVWVADRDGTLWSCNADAEGLVYLNVPVRGDLLEGHGSEFVGDVPTPAGTSFYDTTARDLCLSVAGLTQEVTLVATAPDGLGDSIVWLRMADRQLWFCNASAEGALFVFEPVGFPIEEEAEPLVTAEGSS